MCKLNLLLTGLLMLGLATCQAPKEQQLPNDAMVIVPNVKTNEQEVDTLSLAFSIAVGDIVSNLKQYKGGLLTDSAIVYFAGIDYYGPWARDGAISTQNQLALVAPGAVRNTLLSQLKLDEKGRLVYAGEFWDNLLQAEAHYQYYLASGDTSMLDEAYAATKNTLADRERDEFDERYGLFRGAAGFNDGISGYPDLYARTGTYKEGGHWLSNIKKWPEAPENAAFKAKKGFGLPLMALSTNCVHYQAYQALNKLAQVLGRSVDTDVAQKAEKLKLAINKQLWMPDKGMYRYYKDPNGDCDHQEAMGICYAVMMGIADSNQAKAVVKNAVLTPGGIPCLWPGFDRYNKFKGAGQHYPRHAQTVWSLNQSFWCKAARMAGNDAAFNAEFEKMTRYAVRDMQFREIYHPITGMPYGGVQEDNTGQLILWKSTERQAWAATGYLRTMVQDIAGLTLTTQGLELHPHVDSAYGRLLLGPLAVRGRQVSIAFRGHGDKIVKATLNGAVVQQWPLAYDKLGAAGQTVKLEVWLQ